MAEDKQVKPGKYLHFKGMIMEVIGIAKHSETLEEYVVYKHNNELWVRPKKMFFEEVEVQGKKVPRFKFVGN